MVVILIEIILEVHDVLLTLAELNSSQPELVDTSAFPVYLGAADDSRRQVLEVKYVTVPGWYDSIGIFPPGHPENDVSSTWCVDGTVLLSECDCRMH